MSKLNIKIVPPNPNYAECFYQWRNEPNTIKFNPIKLLSLEEVRENLLKAKTSLKPLESSTTYRWFIELDNHLVRTVSLSEVNLMMG